jgi:hypothetical protein
MDVQLYILNALIYFIVPTGFFCLFFRTKFKRKPFCEFNFLKIKSPNQSKVISIIGLILIANVLVIYRRDLVFHIYAIGLLLVIFRKRFIK